MSLKPSSWFVAGAMLFSLAAAARAQTVIENPAKPLAKDAGRVLKLAEVWRITDESGEFFFKYPHDLQIAEDGSILLAEAEQFLRFSADGRFLKNLYRNGQGPGEIGREFSYDTYGPDLFIQGMNSQRFWRADLSGVLQEQISLANRELRGFIGAVPDGFLFLRSVWPPPAERTGKLLEVLETVALIDKHGSPLRDIVTFRPKMFMGLDSGMSWDPEILALSTDRKFLCAVHSREYVIEFVDLATGAPVRRIRRIYPKVGHVEADWEPGFRSRTGAPKISFEPDIAKLFPVTSGLWVETSTDDKVKGRLIDVFDKDGRFVDSFYLGVGKALMAVRDDDLYCQEKGEDETISIVKYRIDKGERGR
jgi:hypothetical protein